MTQTLHLRATIDMTTNPQEAVKIATGILERARDRFDQIHDDPKTAEAEARVAENRAQACQNAIDYLSMGEF